MGVHTHFIINQTFRVFLIKRDQLLTQVEIHKFFICIENRPFLHQNAVKQSFNTVSKGQSFSS